MLGSERVTLYLEENDTLLCDNNDELSDDESTKYEKETEKTKNVNTSNANNEAINDNEEGSDVEGKEIITNTKKKCTSKRKIYSLCQRKPTYEEERQQGRCNETHTPTNDDEDDDSKMITNTPVNNPMHNCYVKNMVNSNYHPDNSINKNRNMVVLQAPEKFLKDTKPKLEQAEEIREQIKKTQPPHECRLGCGNYYLCSCIQHLVLVENQFRNYLSH